MSNVPLFRHFLRNLKMDFIVPNAWRMQNNLVAAIWQLIRDIHVSPHVAVYSTI